MGTASLFVTDNDTARKRPVTTGAINGDLVEIRSGLKAGERYVTRGGFNLKDGDKVVAASGK
jgi:multidrug efflux pump subunit AcrA (membrane-fusion protein)